MSTPAQLKIHAEPKLKDATLLLWKKGRTHEFYRRHIVVVWAIVVLYKMQDEWITHVGNIDRSELIRGLFS